ncbi:hypothetical protein [Dactylosporangium sp. NPDC005555]|uniref:hypothetical protein n=1 Tax=Dactylosporangium sp. NPDC005555 TaxID=3154889 RepID=UPI0033B852FC
MRTDLDRRLAATLHARSGDDVDPAPIVAHARRHGRRIRLRRRVVAGAAVCAVLVALAATVPWQRPPAVPAAPAVALALPLAPGVPGALERPDAVGADPGVVHFAADDAIGGADYATWSSGYGTESVEYLNRARIVLAASVEALQAAPLRLPVAGSPTTPVDARVGDRPGTAWSDLKPDGLGRLWSVRWQPGDGLWAQLDLYAADQGEAVAAAARVTFDEARRCVVPFSLRALPAGARVLGCSVVLGTPEHDGFAEGTLIVGDGAGRWLTVRAERTPPGMEQVTGDLAAGPYQAARTGDGLLEMLVRPCLVDLFLTDRGNGYTEQDGLRVLGGYLPVQDIDRPDTW